MDFVYIVIIVISISANIFQFLSGLRLEVNQKQDQTVEVQNTQMQIVQNANVNIVSERIANLKMEHKKFDNSGELELFLYQLDDWQKLYMTSINTRDNIIVIYPVINYITKTNIISNTISNYTTNSNTNYIKFFWEKRK